MKLFRIFWCLAFVFSVVQPAFSKDDVRLTEAQGDVYKRGFVDWEREVWSEPVPARQGDMLHEGMQIGTGEHSRAQITWPKVTTRVWSNSVYAIAPNQRLVYLLGGEMLYQLDKKRKRNSEYYVWTKLIQARMRGTTVLFQSSGNTTRMTVLEGCAEVLNRLDRSVIRVKPGAVVEVTEKQVTGSLPGGSNSTAGSNDGESPSIATGSGIQIFDTASTTTSLYKADSIALLSNSLISNFTGPLKSLSLVQDALGAMGTAGVPALSSIAEIVAVPKKLSYSLGPQVGTAIPLPPALISEFPPQGISAVAPVAPFDLSGSSKQVGQLSGGIGTGAAVLQSGTLNTGAAGMGQSLTPSAAAGVGFPAQILNTTGVGGTLNSLVH
ncbi:MAG: FecR domain-containing protein [Candidatus Obscuribacterales bacterium]|nr:FecR domain-containing protein [Candidatus Obscuribacterales bacterium]